MIAGILHTNFEKQVTQKDVSVIFGDQELSTSIFEKFGIGASKEKTSNTDFNSFVWKNEKTSLGFVGNIYNKAEIFTNSSSGKPIGEFLAEKYRDRKFQLFNDINGNYILAFWDKEQQSLTVARDHLGVEPLYYYWDEKKFVFSSSLKSLLQHPDIKPEINFNALYAYLLFNYNPLNETLIKGVKKLRPGHYLQVKNGKLNIERYWHLSFADGEEKSEAEYTEELLAMMKDTVGMRVAKDEKSHGAFLSGGMDSSSVVGLMAPFATGKIHSFSFRCKGKSFDESHYAKIVSDRYNTENHLIEFSPEEILNIPDIVEKMDEPFCDIGIEVASYILGREAEGKINYVLTGDGGDELFAGHPVYQADEVAKKFSRIPKPLQKMMTSVFSLFPDTDKKKSFAVKAQRFAYSYSFPEALFSNRWRIYYQKPELFKLFDASHHDDIKQANPLDEIIDIYDEADGEDYLSKTLYGDYQTVVDFYLRRMHLLRTFGIEARFPMFDPRLVEYAAKIPSDLKLRGSETKYILHKTMAGVLPDEIVFRKDKLGHSVPFKNWLRDVPEIKRFINTVLSEETVKKRGLFNYSFVQKLLSDHDKKTKNNSHRIWALVVLELWMQKNIDN